MASSFTFTRNKTLPDSSAKADFHDLIDGAGTAMTATVSGIEMSEIDWATADADVALTRTSTTTDILTVTGNSLTSGSLAVFTSSGTLTDAAVKIISSTAGNTGEALFIDNNATAGEAIYIDAENTTGNIVDIEADPLTTAYVINVDNANALTTGGIAYLYSNAAATDTRNLVNIINDNVLADSVTCLRLQNDGDNYNIQTNSITGGGILLNCSGTSAAGTYLLYVKHSGTPDGGAAVRIDGSSTANATNTVTISNVAPAGVGTATISKWLTVYLDADTYYIPCWT